MDKKQRPEWNDRYQTGDLPWETGRVDKNLTNIIADYSIEPCRVLDIGCGTGNNAIWLAEQGFTVSALDLASAAIEMAEKKSCDLNINYSTLNFMTDSVDGFPFGLVFDRGCFHCMDTLEERKSFAARVADLLNENGIWLSLIGNADGPEREMGPPKLAAEEIISAVESSFKITMLKSSFFDSDQEDPPLCWACLMEKR
jgi:2-polyprenyl-3-methyl-5-hydroxy-6-metoxy-1,4-benzoquinol methylase